MKRRATPTERTTARVFREAGACVRQNVFLRDMNVNVPAQDSRQIEVLAQDLPCSGGMQLAVDITLRSAVSCAGEAHPRVVDHDGAVLLQARQDKEATYPELASSGRCKLLVLAMETGGRRSEEAVQTRRMLAIACAVSFDSSLLEPARNASWSYTFRTWTETVCFHVCSKKNLQRATAWKSEKLLASVLCSLEICCSRSVLLAPSWLTMPRFQTQLTTCLCRAYDSALRNSRGSLWQPGSPLTSSPR